MNEQIQKLYDQADKFAKENRTQNIAALGNNYFELFHEKFAELIVQECAELAKKKAFIIMQKAEEYAADKEEIINATSAAFHLAILEQEIRKYFGVEE